MIRAFPKSPANPRIDAFRLAPRNRKPDAKFGAAYAASASDEIDPAPRALKVPTEKLLAIPGQLRDFHPPLDGVVAQLVERLVRK